MNQGGGQMRGKTKIKHCSQQSGRRVKKRGTRKPGPLGPNKQICHKKKTWSKTRKPDTAKADQTYTNKDQDKSKAPKKVAQ